MKPAYWYQRRKLRQTSIWLSPENHEKLTKLAKQADKSRTRYATRLIERHLKEQLEPKK